MTEAFLFKNLEITPIKEGFTEYVKVSCPVRYGLFGEIKTSRYFYQFNQRGEITHIQGRDSRWPNPSEWLKRTVGNDWVYYSSGGYTSVYDLFGEYYAPYLPYCSNSIAEDDPFEIASVKEGLSSVEQLLNKLDDAISRVDTPSAQGFLQRVKDSRSENLKARAEQLHRIIGCAVTVVSPDMRHVDYNVIPLSIADGCLYRCGFCRVKTNLGFAPRPLDNILEQIEGLKAFYGADLTNYNALFLGQLDALNAGAEPIEFAATRAFEILQLGRSVMKQPRLFLFASVDSLLRTSGALFDRFDRLPYYTYINVGLESAHDPTLVSLKKPISAQRVRDAYAKMVDINQSYQKVEVTANFVLGDALAQEHDASIVELVDNASSIPREKGCLYFSPLVQDTIDDDQKKRRIVTRFRKIKRQVRKPAFLYLIQRL